MHSSFLTQFTVFLIFATGVIAALFSLSRFYDNRHLKKLARSACAGAKTDAERIIALTEWVYANQGFAKNRNYFLLKALGPTPMDVLRHGGDCADKSRLLSAMLKRLGIPSTLAMLYPCPDCAPVHTVVEAQSETGWMVVDPVFNLWFSGRPNEYYSHRYLGLEELRFARDLVDARLRYLRQYRGPTDKINHYDADTTCYTHAKTINWDKNRLLFITAKIINNFRIDPYLMRRPYIMEDPKLALAALFAAMTFGLLMLYVILRNNPLLLAFCAPASFS